MQDKHRADCDKTIYHDDILNLFLGPIHSFSILLNTDVKKIGVEPAWPRQDHNIIIISFMADL
jgi:hypothetical protein